jgi:alanyl aminopeptidase
MFSRRAALALTLLSVMLVPDVKAADAPPVFRLGDGATPVQYNVRLVIDPAKDRFDGEVAIDLKINHDTTTLWLNGTDIVVQSAAWETAAKKTVLDASVEGTQFIGLRTAEPLAAGDGVLRIHYQAKIDALSTRGVFRQQEGGAWYVVTQFEATSARRAFPCFDEPGWKTPWQLTLDVPADHAAFSNTPATTEARLENGMKRVTFGRTHLLPSYLIAFAVGPFDVVEGGVAGRNRTVLRYVVPRGRSAETRYARQVTPKLLELLEDYFGTPYPFEKLDSVVIPQTVNFGAMENPGMITYVGTRMLAAPDRETHAFRRGYAGTAAHEIAHMWFGDLVTMAWWDDTWLNEAFATWAGNKAVYRLEPGWDDGVQRAESRRRAMRLDRLVNTRRVQSAVTNMSEVGAAFDSITYQKGGQVLGMFEQALGEERFRDGVRRYLARHSRGNATSADFMAALAEAAGPGSELPAQFAGFIQQPGVPLIRMALECRGPPALRLEQQRLRPVGARAVGEQQWTTPACFRYSVKGRPLEACTRVANGLSQFVLPGAHACPDWVLGNAGGRGYYVVQADDALQKRLLSVALKLPAPEAVTLLGDTALLADSGLTPAGTALMLVEKFSAHAAPAVRHMAVSLLAGMRADWLGPQDKRRHQLVLKNQLLPQARKLGWNEKPGEEERLRALRGVLLPLVADQGGDTALRREAAEAAGRWLVNREALAAGMVDPVLATAAAFADGPLFDKLLQAAMAVTDRAERTRLLQTLVLVRQPALRERAYDLLLDDRLNGRDALAMLGKALADEAGRTWAFAFLRKNYDAIVARLPADAAGNLIGALSGACSEGQRDAFAMFFAERSKAVSGGAFRYAQTLESIELCVAARTAPSLARGIAQVSRTR